TPGAEWPGNSLKSLAQSPNNPDRVVFSEYHAGGSDTAFYMLRKGQFKYIAYVGYPSELFDLFADSEEGRDLSQDPRYASVIQALALTGIDPGVLTRMEPLRLSTIAASAHT